MMYVLYVTLQNELPVTKFEYLNFLRPSSTVDFLKFNNVARLELNFLWRVELYELLELARTLPELPHFI